MSDSLPPALCLELDDVLGNLHHARREGDLGRLALLVYWDVRHWARGAHHEALAGRASDLVGGLPHPSRTVFVDLVDELIAELERIRTGLGPRC